MHSESGSVSLHIAIVSPLLPSLSLIFIYLPAPSSPLRHWGSSSLTGGGTRAPCVGGRVVAAGPPGTPLLRFDSPSSQFLTASREVPLLFSRMHCRGWVLHMQARALLMGWAPDLLQAPSPWQESPLLGCFWISHDLSLLTWVPTLNPGSSVKVNAGGPSPQDPREQAPSPGRELSHPGAGPGVWQESSSREHEGEKGPRGFPG